MLRSLWSKLLLSLVGLIIVVIVGAGLFLSKGKDLEERHYPYDYAETFAYSSGTFEDYIDYSQKHLRAARLDSPSEVLIQNASPFMLEPGPECAQQANGKYLNGIVLSHGLLASPYSMFAIGEYFQSRCFYVLGTLLQDHVTRPGDFIGAHWEDWAETQRFAISALEQKADNIFLSGHSAGATLSIYGAATSPQVDALILFTPALQITPAAKYAKYVSMLAQLFPKAAWFEIRSDEARYRYESLTISAAEETYALIQATQQALANAPLAIPVYSILSVEDNTVDTDISLAFMAQQAHPASKTLLFSQHPREGSDNVKVYETYAPQQGVLSLSHLGIMLPSSHPEYGRDGAYRSCGHYFTQENDNFVQCKAGKRDYYGEVSPQNLQRGLVERIAFNPFYNDLLEELDSFLEAL